MDCLDVALGFKDFCVGEIQKRTKYNRDHTLTTRIGKTFYLDGLALRPALSIERASSSLPTDAVQLYAMNHISE